LCALVIFYNKHQKSVKNRKEESFLLTKKNLLRIKTEHDTLIEKCDKEDQRAQNVLKLYEIIKEITHALDQNELIKLFVDALSRIENIEDVSVSWKEEEKKDYHLYEYRGDKNGKIYVHVKCQDRRILSQFPYIFSQFSILMERSILYEKLQKISITDSLTSLANRRYFMYRYEEEFKRSKRMHLKFSLIMIDVDNFKLLNDTKGHMVGDMVLREVSNILKDNVRDIDFVARYGGEEFIIILPETDKSSAVYAAERIREKISVKNIKAYDENIKITLSFGVSSFPENASSLDMLLEVADKALYQSKNQGKNKVSFF